MSPFTLASFAVAGAFLFFLITRLNIDLDVTWTSFKDSNPGLFLLALLIHYTAFIFRGARWRLWLQNARDDTLSPRPTTLHCGSLIILGQFTNSVTWFHLGDAYRAYAYAEDTQGSFPSTIGTILAEKVLDLALVFLLLAAATLVLVATGVGSPWLVVGLATLMVVVPLAVFLGMRVFRTRLARLLPGPLEAAYHRFHEGTVGSFRHRLALATLLGLLGWMAEVGRLFFVTEGLGFSLTLPLIIVVALANAALTLVPITPGGLGVVEWGTTGLLMLSSRIETDNVAFSIVALDRSISWLSIIVIGVLLLVGRGVLKRRRKQVTAAPEPPSGSS